MRNGYFGFAFDPAEWFTGQRGQRRSHRRWFDQGDMKYVILKLLRERPMHGYEVMKALEEKTNGCYKPSPGTVYPTLQWLEDEGLAAASDASGKKVYTITDAGVAFLDENKDTVEDIFERIGDMIDRIVSEPVTAINRGISRIAKQAYRTAWKLPQDDPRHQQIVDILERTAKDLEAVSRP